jgi:cyclopropane fatty-acyl-phospholipid synthase-like methyltransferase
LIKLVSSALVGMNVNAGTYDATSGKVRDGYDSIADQYMELVVRPRAKDPRSAWTNGLLGRLTPGSRVLDLGCGPGVPTAEALVHNGHRVTGIDISPRQVALAQSNVPQGRFVVGDALESHFASRSFDAIVALFSLTHIPRDEWAPLFGRFIEWLHPEGWLLATFGMSDSAGWHEENFLGFGHTNWTNGFAPETSQRLLREAGFDIDRAEVIEEELPSGVERWLWILGRASAEK